MGKPDTGDVTATYGLSLSQHPNYLVHQSSIPFSPQYARDCHIKLIDFGQASLNGKQREVHCPLVFRAPETFFEPEWDSQADVWSLGCTVRS